MCHRVYALAIISSEERYILFIKTLAKNLTHIAHIESWPLSGHESMLRWDDRSCSPARQGDGQSRCLAVPAESSDGRA
jgi:hypothetical protein